MKTHSTQKSTPYGGWLTCKSHTLSEGDIEKTLASYNGGHGQIPKGEILWPDETLRYVKWGSAIYQEAVKGENQGNALAAWLEAGGWRLCRAAEERLIID